MNKIKMGTGIEAPPTPGQEEIKKILDLSFFDVMEELGPEDEEVKKLSKNGAEDKIISKIVSIINGDDIDERADLRRELRGLSAYKKGAIAGLINHHMSIDKETKEKIQVLIEPE